MDLPVLSHLRGGRAASLWAAKGGQHPAGITVCRADRHQETDTGVLQKGVGFPHWTGRPKEISCRRWYTWTKNEKTPHLHLTFVPLTKDNRLCAKEIIGNRANLTKWQDDFHAYMVEKFSMVMAASEKDHKVFIT